MSNGIQQNMNWTFNDRKDGIWDNDDFNTREEAIAGGDIA